MAQTKEEKQVIRKLYYAKNKEKFNARDVLAGREYRKNNPEEAKEKDKLRYLRNKKVCNESAKRYIKLNKEKVAKKESERLKRASKNVLDTYVKIILKRACNLKGIEIPQEIIDLKRILIKTERLCRQLKNS